MPSKSPSAGLLDLLVVAAMIAVSWWHFHVTLNRAYAFWILGVAGILAFIGVFLSAE